MCDTRLSQIGSLDFPEIAGYVSLMDAPTKNVPRARRIGVLPVPGFAMMSFAALTEPMRAANLLARKTLYALEIVADTSEPIASSGAGVVVPKARLGQKHDYDYVFVIAGGDPTRFSDTKTLNWLARIARQGIPLGGVSGGPIILAKAGLMDGRRMTVHWEHAAALSEISPHLLVEKSLYVIDRDRVTCAGGTAPMDLMHALIAQHHGVKFARLVSDWFMHTEVRPSAGPQRAGLVERVGTTVPAILDAVEAMEGNVADPLSLERISSVAGLSSRQLNRLFSDKLGQTVMQFYRVLRLEKAQSLLRNSPLSITEIALATGFANSSHFSRCYTAQYGQPPSAYR